MGKNDSSSRTLSVATVAVAVTNLAILMLCEMSVQVIAVRSAVFVKHAVSFGVAAVALVVVEAVLATMQAMSHMGRQGSVIMGELTSTSVAGHPPIGRSMFLWWPVATWLVPLFLFWFANGLIGWEPSGIPYGMFFGLYLMMRVLAILRQN